MKLSEEQRERLWHIMIGAGCSPDWLMYHGEYLCENIASLIERQPVRPGPIPNSITRHYNPPSDFGTGMITGMIIGNMMG